MPKGATLAKNRDGLINEADLEKIKLQNEKSREVIEQNNLLKKQDDAEAMLHSKILNALRRSLVKLAKQVLLFALLLIFRLMYAYIIVLAMKPIFILV